MRHVRWTVIVVIASLGFVGCGGRQSSEGAAGGGAANPAGAGTARAGTAADAASPSQPPSEAPPQEVVTAFLKALRNGDETMAARLLTAKSREETAKQNLAVQPPGAPSATYQVGRVDFPAEQKDVAYVLSTWSEKDQDGVAYTYEITWALRRQSDGWRVAGMATSLGEGQQPIFLNFEDPKEMLRKWSEVDPDLAAEGRQTPQQARKPDRDQPAATPR